MGNEATSSQYDVIVIGAGVAGLTSGALLAQAGKRVLIVEKEEHPGGFARDLQRGPYRINPVLHVVMGCNQSGALGQGVIDAVLNQLGVQDRCEFATIDPFYRALLPDLQIDVIAGRDGYLESYLRHFPDEADGLRNLVDLCRDAFKEFVNYPAIPRWLDFLLMPARFPKMFRHANASLGSVMDKYLSNPRLKAAYAILYSYLALPPSRASFLQWAIMMTSYLEQGASTCLGGFHHMISAFAEGLTNHGGELLMGVRVTGIRSLNGEVQGIKLDSGQEINAKVIISNIDARATVQELIAADQVPARYLQKVQRMEPSASVLSLHLATDLDVKALGLPKVTVMASWDLEDTYAAPSVGRVKGLGMHIPTVVDASLAPPGEHLVILQTFVPTEVDTTKLINSAGFAESFLDLAERVLPNLREHITYVDGHGENDGQQYPLHKMGPAYGWAALPQQTGPRRLAYQTPIAGLYLTGHWTQPGHGIWTVVLSGVNAARLVLGRDMSEPLWTLDF